VITLFDGNLPGDTQHAFNWNGKDEHGRQVKRGVYLIRATISGKTANYKLVLIR
jgi:flagellar hook assembly protein FlgD